MDSSALEPKVQQRATFRLRNFFATLGPGLITGASDDDPSGIGTYSQAGAQLGFGIGWTMLLTYPLMVAIQEISARIWTFERYQAAFRAEFEGWKNGSA